MFFRDPPGRSGFPRPPFRPNREKGTARPSQRAGPCRPARKSWQLWRSTLSSVAFRSRHTEDHPGETAAPELCNPGATFNLRLILDRPCDPAAAPSGGASDRRGSTWSLTTHKRPTGGTERRQVTAQQVGQIVTWRQLALTNMFRHRSGRVTAAVFSHRGTPNFIGLTKPFSRRCQHVGGGGTAAEGRRKSEQIWVYANRAVPTRERNRCDGGSTAGRVRGG